MLVLPFGGPVLKQLAMPVSLLAGEEENTRYKISSAKGNTFSMIFFRLTVVVSSTFAAGRINTNTSSFIFPSFSNRIALPVIVLNRPFSFFFMGKSLYSADAIREACPSNPAYSIVRLNAGSFFTLFPISELFIRA